MPQVEGIELLQSRLRAVAEGGNGVAVADPVSQFDFAGLQSGFRAIAESQQPPAEPLPPKEDHATAVEKAKNVGFNLLKGINRYIASNIQGAVGWYRQLDGLLQDVIGNGEVYRKWRGPIEENPIWKGAQGFIDQLEGRRFHPELKGSLLYETGPEAVGQGIGFVGTGVFGKLLGAGTKTGVGVGLLGGKVPGVAGKLLGNTRFTAGVAGINVSTADLFKQARQGGATSKDAETISRWGAPLGLTEIIGIPTSFFRTLQIANKASGGRLMKAVKTGGRVAVDTLTEMFQEGGQQIGSNVVLKINGIDQKTLEGVVESGKVGGFAGFVMSLIANAVGLRRARIAQTLAQIPKGKAFAETEGEVARRDPAFRDVIKAAPELNLPELNTEARGDVRDAVKQEVSQPVVPREEVGKPPRQPYEMTKKEFGKAFPNPVTSGPGKDLSPTISFDLPSIVGKAFAFEGTPEHHKLSVREAISKGKTVPPEVLKDYPDLAKAAQQAPAKTLPAMDRWKQTFEEWLAQDQAQIPGVDPQLSYEGWRLTIGIQQSRGKPVPTSVVELARNNKTPSQYYEAKQAAQPAPVAETETAVPPDSFRPVEAAEGAAVPPVVPPTETAAQPSEQKLFGRPDLANPALDDRSRALVDIVDEARNLRGEPTRRSRMEAQAEADARLEQDYEGERQRLIDGSHKGLAPSDTEAFIGKAIITREGVKSIESGSGEAIMAAMDISWSYRERRTELSREFGAGVDQRMSPQERLELAISESILLPPDSVRKKLAQAYADRDVAAIAKLKDEWLAEVLAMRSRLKSSGVDLDNLSQIVKDPVATANALKAISIDKADAWDKLYEYWLSAILSLPTTHIVNQAGNTATIGIEFMAQRFAEAVVAETRRLGGAKVDGASFGELVQVWKGFLPGVKIGARNFVMTYRTEMPALEAQHGLAVTTKFEEHRVKLGKPGTKRGAAARGLRAISITGLVATDDFNKSISSRMEVGATAYREGKNAGLKGDDLTQYVADQINDPYSDSWGRAIELATDLAFQKPLEKVGQIILGARRVIPGARYRFPFLTVPGNIIKTGVRKSVLGSVRLAARLATGKKISNRDVSEQLLAWAGLFAVWYVLDDDDGTGLPLITGSEGSLVARERGQAERTMPAFSIRLPGTNKMFNYSRMEPFATWLGITVDIVNGIKKGDVSKVQTAILGQLHSKSWFGDLSDILRMFEPGRDSAAALAKWASGFIVSWIPNFVRGGVRATTETFPKRDIPAGADYWKRVGKRTLQRTEILPLLGVIEDQPVIDFWGREARRGPDIGPNSDIVYRFISPFRIKTIDVALGDRVILNWNKENPEDGLFKKVPSRRYTFKGKKQLMSDPQYTQFLVLSGKVADQLVNIFEPSPVSPKTVDIDVVNTAIDWAHREAKAILIPIWNGKDADVPSVDDLTRKIMFKLRARAIPSRSKGQTVEESKMRRAPYLKIRQQINKFFAASPRQPAAQTLPSPP